MQLEKNEDSNFSLVLNDSFNTIFNEINSSLETCNKFYFNVAFINYGGFQLFIKTMKELEEKSVEGKIITSTYLNFTEPKAIRKMKEFSNIDLKVYGDVKTRGFHSKAYIFEYDEYYKIIIGSANMTGSALKNNIEWNIKVISKKEDNFSSEVLSEFTKLWDSLEIVTDDFLDRYEAFIKTMKASDKIQQNFIYQYEASIKPNSMQKLAIEKLNDIRLSGETKGFVIAATGTGKTYMSAFDVYQVKPNKVLFLVHREDILRKAEESFKRVLGSKIDSGLFTGTEKNDNAKYLFSMMQTMNNHYEMFDREEFDYIIIDEAHHATSATYQRLLDYFKPKFLLGMTATPERTDGADIFELFDNNVAVEVRLQQALEDGLIVPFHYFGITDINCIDLENVNLDNISEVSKRLKVHERVEYIIEQMNLYGFQGETLKCLGFCVDRDHARYMSEEFNKKGIVSVSLTGNDDVNTRDLYTRRLEDNDNPLQVIFTVDIFNEGVDIPSVNMVLLLRPTNSPIVFIQQLGRGLRKSEDKEYLTVLDFIGNYNRAYLIAIALKGSRYYDKDGLKVSVHNNFADLPGEVYVQMDEIAKERILNQLNMENFQAFKYLKEEYLTFKIQNSGRIPYFMMDYLKYEGSPNPLRYLKREGTYIDFLSKVEKGIDFSDYLYDVDFMKALKYLSDLLPIKRPHEFVIIKMLLNTEELCISDVRVKIERYIHGVTTSSISHAIATLNFNYYDSAQKKRWLQLVESEHMSIKATSEFEKIKQNKKTLAYIEDILNYGLYRYQREFTSTTYHSPFFELYKGYTMQETALLSEYEKTHTSFRGSGLCKNGNQYFLFIDLHKDANVKESINYKDKFIDRLSFQWESPNNTAQTSETGKNIIFNEERDIHLHLFIRKFSSVDGVAQSYIYFGEANTISYENERPIKVILRLEHEVPVDIYNELITKV